MRFLSLFLVISTALAVALPTEPSFTDPSSTEVVLPELLPPTENTNHTLVRHGFAKCETTTGSPLISDITRAINGLKARGGTCYMNNDWWFGSYCQHQINEGTADISMCTPKHSTSAWMPCTEVARGAKEVRDRCAWNGRAGGRWDFDDFNVNAVVR